MPNSNKSDSIKALPKQSRYKPEYCDKLIAHMSKGLSIDTFGATVNVSRATIYEWASRHREFAEAKEKAIQKAQDFMESRLMAKISGQELKGVDVKKIDTTCLIFALKTRFHKTYGDRQKLEHDVTDKAKKTIELAYNLKELKKESE